MTTDPLEGVLSKYRVELSPSLAADVDAAAGRLNLDVLLPAMLSWVSEKLVEGHMADKGRIKDFIGYVEIALKSIFSCSILFCRPRFF